MRRLRVGQGHQHEALHVLWTHLAGAGCGCLPKPGAKQSVQQQASATIQFHRARQRHPGVESAIGALQSGNGLKRCRDRSEVGFDRYVALAILGRNLHTLGKLLIAQQDADCQAATSKRKRAA